MTLNGNTLENSIDQYISMIQEKTVAGSSPAQPDVPNVFPFSELIFFWGNPFTLPGYYVGQARHGTPMPPITNRAK